MKWNPLKWPILCSGGILVIVFYCLLTFTSYLLYPHPYSPLDHYLSRLGDWSYSPVGAFFYNIGCVLTGSSLFLFYAGFRKWYGEKKWRKTVIITTQAIGISSAFALIMIGVFSEDLGAPHNFWSSTFFILNFVGLILVNLALITHPKFVKPIGLYGLTVTILSLVLTILNEVSGLPISGALIEWFTVFSALCYVGLLAFNTFKLQSR